MLRVAVLSEDDEIQRLCRDTLAQIAGLDWALTTPDEEGEGLASDICVWDVHPGMTLPASLTVDNSFNNLFIVSPGQLGEVAPSLPALRCIDRSLRRLTRMAAAMFELSIGRQMQGHITFQAADLEATVAQVLREIGPFSSEKHISITADLGPATNELHFDASQIEQVLLNLLDNACRFTPRHGSIEVSGYAYFWDRRLRNTPGGASSGRRHEDSRAPNCYRIDIRDSGPGIPPEHLGGIFDEHTPYANSSDRSGGGLALAVCKTIMEAHHGRVWAEPGTNGAIFCLVIPFCHPEPAPGARPDGRNTTSDVFAGAEKQ